MMAFFCAQLPLMLAERWLGQALTCARRQRAGVGRSGRCASAEAPAAAPTGLTLPAAAAAAPLPLWPQPARLDATRALQGAGHPLQPAAAVALHLLAGQRPLRLHAERHQRGAAGGRPAGGGALVTSCLPPCPRLRLPSCDNCPAFLLPPLTLLCLFTSGFLCSWETVKNLHADAVQNTGGAEHAVIRGCRRPCPAPLSGAAAPSAPPWPPGWRPAPAP